MQADFGMSMPLYIAGGSVAVYAAIKCLRPGMRQWGGTMTAFWLMVAFSWMMLANLSSTGMTGISTLGLTGGLLITGIGAAGAFASQGRLDPNGSVHFYYPLYLLALAGAVAIGFATDLFTIFVAVELSALPVYVLCAYRYKEDPKSLVSATKYLIQGVVGTITALLGVSLLFVAGHTLQITALPAALAAANPVPVLAGAALIIVGYGVKLAIVPLHTWLPEAYSRAPVGVTAIMVGATKIGVLLGVFLSLSALPVGPAVPHSIGLLIIALSIVTMTAGNLLALNQRELKNVLSYSSVAQMGYILLGFGIGMAYDLPLGFTAGLYYAIAYGVMKSGAFLVADAFELHGGSPDLSSMKGMGARNPVLGLSLAVFIFGLIGIPFTSGFLGKLLLVQAGMVTLTLSGFVLALILVANSAISLGYYVPVLSTVLFGEASTPGSTAVPLKVPATLITAITLLAIITVYFGFFSGSFTLIAGSAHQLFTPGGL